MSKPIPYEHLLGKLPDALIASLYGLSNGSNIAAARARRAIPPFQPPTVCRIDWDRLDFLLGWFTDLEVARLLNVAPQSIQNVRTRCGFAPRFPSGRRPSLAEKRAMVYPGPHPRGVVFKDETDPYRAAFEGRHPVDGMVHLARLLAHEEFSETIGDFDVATQRVDGTVRLLGEPMTPEEADRLAIALRAAAAMMRRVDSRRRGA